MNHEYAIFLIKQEIETIKKDMIKKYKNNPDELKIVLSFNSDLIQLQNSLKHLNKK